LARRSAATDLPDRRDGAGPGHVSSFERAPKRNWFGLATQYFSTEYVEIGLRILTYILS
jgi:hypothetical protein